MDGVLASTGSTFQWNSGESIRYTKTFQRKGIILTIQLHLSSKESKLIYKINDTEIFTLYNITREDGLNYRLAISMYVKGVCLELVN